MTRYLNLALICTMILVVAAVYQIKYDAETAAETVRGLKAEVDKEREAIALLKAEWSLLNQPARLQALVERHPDYLELVPLDPIQIGELSEIPMRPEPVDETTASIEDGQ